MRIGSQFRLHLARELTLDGTALAPANAFARLLVTDKVKRADGTIVLSLAIDSFRIAQGLLPVEPITADVTEVTKGMLVPAKLDGSVERMNDRLVIRVPAFVPLGTIAPNSAFTALPVVTPAPVLPVQRRGATPTPQPTTFNPPEPSAPPDPSATPDGRPTPMMIPTPLPTPTA